MESQNRKEEVLEKLSQERDWTHWKYFTIFLKRWHLESFASREMFFSFSRQVYVLPPTMLSYQMSSEVKTFLSLRSKNSFKGFRWLRYSLKESTGQFGLGFSYIKPPSKPSSFSRRFFVNSSVALHTQRAPVLSMFNEKSVLLSWRRLWQHYFKNNFVLNLNWIIQTKGSAFVYRWLVFNFYQPLLHFAPNTLFASVNCESLMMSKPRVALKCRFNANLRFICLLFLLILMKNFQCWLRGPFDSFCIFIIKKV